jgi:CelD/BcsL family acetyltransferase involved in cellulose biosynthesis
MTSVRFSVVTDEVTLRHLKNEWNTLSQDASAPFYVSYSYCFETWLQIQKPLGRSLFCVIGRYEGKLIFVWPFVKYQNKRLWTLLRALTSHAAEYSDILISPDVDRINMIKQAWPFVCEQSRAHIINLPFVLSDTVLSTFINDLKFTGVEQDTVPFLELQQNETWESYYTSLGGNHRRSMTRRRKVLAMYGVIDYRIAESNDDIKPYLAWLIENKREWVKLKDKADASLDTEDFQNFLVEMSTGAETRHLIKVFGLLINDSPVSVKVIVIGKTQVNRIIAAYSTEYAKASPGMLLDEYVMKWIIDNNYNCNFGVGGETSKLVWSRNNLRRVASYQIPVNYWGRLAFYLWKYAKAYKNRKNKATSGASSSL